MIEDTLDEGDVAVAGEIGSTLLKPTVAPPIIYCGTKSWIDRGRWGVENKKCDRTSVSRRQYLRPLHCQLTVTLQNIEQSSPFPFLIFLLKPSPFEQKASFVVTEPQLRSAI